MIKPIPYTIRTRYVKFVEYLYDMVSLYCETVVSYSSVAKTKIVLKIYL